MWINVGVEVVVVRQLCGSAVALGVSVFVAGPALRCRVRGAAACRVLPSLGARRRAPNPRTRGWWRSLSGFCLGRGRGGFLGCGCGGFGLICQTYVSAICPDKHHPTRSRTNR